MNIPRLFLIWLFALAPAFAQVSIAPTDISPRTGTGSAVLSNSPAFTGAPTLNGIPLTGGGGGAVGVLVSTISNLRSVDVSTYSTGQIATVLGHTAAGDGGGGSFYFVSAVTYTDDNGLLIAPTVGTGRWFRLWSGALNVRWYGATGDGTTNDAAAVQAAFSWYDNNPVSTEINGNGRVYFPRGRYKLTGGVTIHNGHGMTVCGDGAYTSSLEIDTTTAAMITVNGYINLSFVDLSFSNTNGGGNTSGSQTTSKAVYLVPSSGTTTTFERCVFTNWVDCVKVGSASDGDSGLFVQCSFKRSKNAWYTDNPNAGIQKFVQCVYDQISVGAVNTQGVGQIHLDTINFVGAGSVFYLRPVYATWGASSNYIVTNGKMEWTSPNSRWINCEAIDGSETYPTATFTFNECSMSGGDGGDATATDVIMSLCGAMNVTWNGGNFVGALKYTKNLQLATATNLSSGVRTEIIFNNAKTAPLPSTSITVFDPSGGVSGAAGPVFVYRGNSNVPDMEFGGEVGYNYRQRHTLKYQPYLKGTVSVSSGSTPYDSTIDFFGRTVRIESVVFVADSSLVSAGTRRAELFSDSGRTTSLGYVQFTSTDGKYDLPLTYRPTIFVDKIYTRYTTPAAGDTFGYWLIDYTVFD